MYEKIKRWYIQGLWNADMVNTAVSKDVITKEQAKEILQEDM